MSDTQEWVLALSLAADEPAVASEIAPGRIAAWCACAAGAYMLLNYLNRRDEAKARDLPVAQKVVDNLLRLDEESSPEQSTERLACRTGCKEGDARVWLNVGQRCRVCRKVARVDSGLSAEMR